MSWICSECRHDNCGECKGTIGGDTCGCGHLTEAETEAIVQTIYEERYQAPSDPDCADYLRNTMVGQIVRRTVQLLRRTKSS